MCVCVCFCAHIDMYVYVIQSQCVCKHNLVLDKASAEIYQMTLVLWTNSLPQGATT